MREFFRLLVVWIFFMPFISVAQPENPIFYRLLSNYGFISDRTTCVYQDHLGFIWIGTEEGLSRYVRLAGVQGNAFIDFTKDPEDSTSISDDYVKVIFQDSKNNLWIGTKSGLNSYYFESDHFKKAGNKGDLIRTATINVILEWEGLLYCGTNSGVIVYDPYQGITLQHWPLKNEDQQPVIVRDLALKQNTLLAGTSAGMFALSPQGPVRETQFEDMDLSSLHVDKDFVLAGSFNKGLLKIVDAGKSEIINTANNIDLNSNHINDIRKLRDGTIWIATNAGINTLNSDATEITRSYQYDFNEWTGISDPVIRQIFQDKEEGVWLTTPLGGVSLYHAADNLFQYYTQKTDQPGKNELLDFSITALQEDRDNKLIWLGSRKGLSLFDPSKNVFEHFPYNKDDASNQIYSLDFDKSSSIYVGTEKGLKVFDRNSGNYQDFKYFDVQDRVNTTLVDQDNRLWIGTENRGLFILDIEKPLREKTESGPGNNPEFYDLRNVNDIIQRKDGVVWIATGSGIFYYENNELRKYGPVDDDHSDLQVNHLRLTPDNDLLLSTKHQGILKVKANNQFRIFANKESGLSTNNIASVMPDPSGNGWWVSGDKGLSRITMKNGRISKISNFNVYDGLQGTQFTVKAGAVTSEKVLFGGLGGLTIFDPRSIELKNYPLDLVFTKLSINGNTVKPGDETGVLKSVINVTDSIVLKPEHAIFSVEFQGIDYLRPDSLIYQYKLENYDKHWFRSANNIASYTNLERGENYVLRVKANSRLREWSDEIRLHIYTIPYFYETLWFRILAGFLAIGLLFLIYYIRELRARKKRIHLEKMINSRTEELKTLLEAEEKNAIKLARAAEDAKKADKAKSEFLAKISHEMRTPLNGIMGLSQMAKEQEDKGDMLDLIYTSSKSLKGIIDDLLDLGKMEFEKLEIYNEIFSIRKLVEDLQNSFIPQVMEKGIVMDTVIDDAIPENVSGDLLRVRQVLVNLIGNAIKFTEQGHVKMILEKAEDEENHFIIRFKVEDTGIGIHPSQRHKIFSSFEQIDNGLSRKYGGTGLGLAISQRLVSLMGGHITVEGIEPHGSRFQFDLRFNKIATDHSQAEGQEVHLAAGYKILLVEDNPTNVLVASKMLKKAGQLVDNASNGREAIRQIEKDQYDLVLMDIQMPVMDGFEATQLIRKANSFYSNIPIIALTAGVTKDDVRKCFDHGMDDFLSKPVDFNDLKAMLSKYLETN